MKISTASTQYSGISFHASYFSLFVVLIATSNQNKFNYVASSLDILNGRVSVQNRNKSLKLYN